MAPKISFRWKRERGTSQSKTQLKTQWLEQLLFTICMGMEELLFENIQMFLFLPKANM